MSNTKNGKQNKRKAMYKKKEKQQNLSKNNNPPNSRRRIAVKAISISHCAYLQILVIDLFVIFRSRRFFLFYMCADDVDDFSAPILHSRMLRGVKNLTKNICTFLHCRHNIVVSKKMKLGLLVEKIVSKGIKNKIPFSVHIEKIQNQLSHTLKIGIHFSHACQM